jgi:hypothetical protein
VTTPAPETVVLTPGGRSLPRPRLTCGIRGDGSLWCWGTDNSVPRDTERAVPVQIDDVAGWRQVSTGNSRTCASTRTTPSGAGTTAGTVSWPTGRALRSHRPVQVGTTTWREVSSGQVHQCGIQQDGSLWCWGDNYHWELGNSTTSSRRPSSWNRPVATISAGVEHTCGIQQNGTLWCGGITATASWGRFHPEQPGSGTGRFQHRLGSGLGGAPPHLRYPGGRFPVVLGQQQAPVSWGTAPPRTAAPPSRWTVATPGCLLRPRQQHLRCPDGPHPVVLGKQ